MGNTLAIMVTMTTYGTWLRGDRRGWVDDGRILPADPDLEAADRARMKHEPYLLDADVLYTTGEAIGRSLIDRLQLTILALTVQTWHAHMVVAATGHHVADVVKCAKDAVRYHLRPGRPIWGDHYDKRYCFDPQTVRNRTNYVDRHNPRIGLLARPFAFLTDVDEYLRRGHVAHPAHFAPRH